MYFFLTNNLFYRLTYYLPTHQCSIQYNQYLSTKFDPKNHSYTIKGMLNLVGMDISYKGLEH